jgi:hypothetical protein
MVQADFGPGVDFPKRIRNLEDSVRALATRDVLQNASIGAGGITVNGGEIHVTNGGSIVVDGSGTITLPGGAFSSESVTTSALTVNGNETVTGTSALTTVTATTVATTSDMNAGGNVNATGQVTSQGIINSPGTKANTVTVGYSAVYIDSTGNMGGNTSSRRFKTNIGPASYNLDALLALPAYSYQRTTDVLEQGAAAPWFDGMMAEDVAPVMPLHVWYDENGQVEGIRFEELVTPLIQAVARERAQRLAMQTYYESRLAVLEAAANITPPPKPVV